MKEYTKVEKAAMKMKGDSKNKNDSPVKKAAMKMHHKMMKGKKGEYGSDYKKGMK